MSNLIANLVNMIILLAFASLVAATDIYAKDGDIVAINRKPIHNKGHISIIEKNSAEFAFNWPNGENRACIATFTWPASIKTLYVNTKTMCLQKHTAAASGPLRVNKIPQCCPLVQSNSKQSTEPGNPGTELDISMAPSTLYPEEPTQPDEKLVAEAYGIIPEPIAAPENVATTTPVEETTPIEYHDEQQVTTEDNNLKRKRGAGFSGRWFRA